MQKNKVTSAEKKMSLDVPFGVKQAIEKNIKGGDIRSESQNNYEEKKEVSPSRQFWFDVDLTEFDTDER